MTGSLIKSQADHGLRVPILQTTYNWISPGARPRNREGAILVHQLKFPSLC